MEITKEIHVSLTLACVSAVNRMGYHQQVYEGGPPIDEMALLFSTEAHLDQWMEFANVDPLFQHTRTERDTMVRQDHQGRDPQRWDVRFEFFQMRVAAGQNPWRIEAMCVLDGYAPLHQNMLIATEGMPAIIHASYKLPDEAAYLAEAEKLRSAGMKMRAEYANSYGLFSYWQQAGMRQAQVYIKPRVNLRDQ